MTEEVKPDIRWKRLRRGQHVPVTGIPLTSQSESYMNKRMTKEYTEAQKNE